MLPGFEPPIPLNAMWESCLSESIRGPWRFGCFVAVRKDSPPPPRRCFSSGVVPQRGVELEEVHPFVPECLRKLSLWTFIARSITRELLVFLADYSVVLGQQSPSCGMIVLFGRCPIRTTNLRPNVPLKRLRPEGRHRSNSVIALGFNGYSIFTGAAPRSPQLESSLISRELNLRAQRLDVEGVRQLLIASSPQPPTLSKPVCDHVLRLSLKVLFTRLDPNHSMFGDAANAETLAVAVARLYTNVEMNKDVPLAFLTHGVKLGRISWLRHGVRGGIHRDANLLREFNFFLWELLPHVGCWLRRLFHLAVPTRFRSLLLIQRAWWDILNARQGRHALQSLLSLVPLTKSDVAKIVAGSPLRGLTLCCNITLRPDGGSKLRPISTTRIVSPVSLYKNHRLRLTPNNDCSRSDCSKRKRPLKCFAKLTLRSALGCLTAGKRLVSAFVAVVRHRNHNGESEQWRAFARAAAREQRQSTITFIKADATRCFDLLPQHLVLRKITEWLCDPLYYEITLLGWGPTAEADAPTRRWTVTVSEREVTDARLPPVPRGWVSYVERSDAVDGAYARSILEHHCSQHVVSIDGSYYLQRRGVAQGSPVAPLLCDGCLEAVDESLAALLETHGNPVGMILRRMDDVLVATTSDAAARAVENSLRAGHYESAGFIANLNKLAVARTPGMSVPWCGLQVWRSPSGFELSVDWSRISACLPPAHSGLADWHLTAHIGASLRSLHLRLPALLFDSEVHDGVNGNWWQVAIAAVCHLLNAVECHAAVQRFRFRFLCAALAQTKRFITINARGAPERIRLLAVLWMVQRHFKRLSVNCRVPLALWCVSQQRICASIPPKIIDQCSSDFSHALAAVSQAPVFHRFCI